LLIVAKGIADSVNNINELSSGREEYALISINVLRQARGLA
jgi:hypothetical protein